KAVEKFLTDYSKPEGAGDGFVKQPINYLMDDVLGHGGVLADPGSVDDSFSRGSVIYRESDFPPGTNKSTHESRTTCL
ncbi:MAG: hypothetical protein MUF34_34465, partial [Polyangiaceae bacterium]|nr:hypothetical protein [Polyangiaceae bacterium]